MRLQQLVLANCLGALLVLAAGCPVVTTDYDTGFNEGFARDDWYWQGYDDGWNTLDDATLYYQGGTIPAPTSPEYDQGFYDGVWYAYNDGYFVDYDYSLTIGFSEGYDAAYFAGYLNFLQTDQHVEYFNGGWADGYEDGFSEGRVFGAYDYEQDLTFDWLDALLDYRSGTDLNFDEINVGTGSYGPVVIYEYGTDPTATAKAQPRRAKDPARLAIRHNAAKASDPPPLSYRTFPDNESAQLDTAPATTPRSTRPLTLTTTWLERIEAYLATMESGAKAAHTRAR